LEVNFDESKVLAEALTAVLGEFDIPQVLDVRPLGVRSVSLIQRFVPLFMVVYVALSTGIGRDWQFRKIDSAGIPKCRARWL